VRGKGLYTVPRGPEYGARKVRGRKEQRKVLNLVSDKEYCAGRGEGGKGRRGR